VTFPKLKKNGPNEGFWWTRERVAKAVKEAVAFGPVDVLNAKAINSGGPFPPRRNQWNRG